MSIQASLENYTKAVKALADHEKDNQPVFDAHKELVFKVIDSENMLRDDVAEANAGVENNDFKVTITPQTQTFADIEEIDKLVVNKILSPEIRAKVVKTNTRPPKITISPKKN